MQFKKIVLLGASRGLGRATYDFLNHHHSESQYLLVSRKIKDELNSAHTKTLQADFADLEHIEQVIQQIKIFNPTEIVYFAAGGPYGNYQEKKWKDHEWAFRVSFMFPAQLLHLILSQSKFFSDLQQIVFIGSSIAEAKPDPQAASYAASKHALKGLITSIQAENPPLKVKLFSPGYMKTDLLPQLSWPRQQGLAQEPAIIAEELVNFMKSDLLIR